MVRRFAGRGRVGFRGGVFWAVVMLASSLAWGAVKELPRPSYAISNIAALVMTMTVIGIACKRFRRI